MNNNFYEIPNDWYGEFNNNFMNGMPNINNVPNMNDMSNMINEMDNNLSDPKTGFLRGNLFNNLYDPYKNYRYRELRPNNKRQEILYNILKYNFALIELQLYLDTNPNDMRMVNLYNRYLNEKKKLVMDYQKNYGPLTMDTNMNKWTWNDSPWPWESDK